MFLKNFTPHPVVIFTPDGKDKLAEIQSSGTARVEEEIIQSGVLDRFENTGLAAGVEVVEKRYKAVVGLPAPVDGVQYIISVIVAAALKGSRADCLVPDTGPDSAVRDKEGKIAGVKRLQKA